MRFLYLSGGFFVCFFLFCFFSPSAAPALRTPLSIAGSYATPFAMMGHHEMNGSLTSPGVYPGLISPQMSAAAAAAYGRSPIVTIPASIKHLLVKMRIYHTHLNK